MFRSMIWKSIKNRSSLKTKARRDPGFFHGSFTHRGLSRFDRSYVYSQSPEYSVPKMGSLRNSLGCITCRVVPSPAWVI